MHRSTSSRRAFLAGGAALAVTPVVAHAAPPTPAPQGDDIGFLQFAATAELVLSRMWPRAIDRAGFATRDTRTVRAMFAADLFHLGRLRALLGSDAPEDDSFAIEFEPAALRTPRRAALAARELVELHVGVLLDGVTSAQDPGTRLLLGRVLAADSRNLAILNDLAGRAAARGLPSVITLQDAGPRLDRYLSEPA